MCVSDVLLVVSRKQEVDSPSNVGYAQVAGGSYDGQLQPLTVSV